MAEPKALTAERLEEIHNWHFTEARTGNDVGPQNMTGQHLWELLHEVARLKALIERLEPVKIRRPKSKAALSAPSAPQGEHPTLAELIETARKLPPMTPEQLRQQCISFAYGNVKLHNPEITRELIAEEYDKLQGEQAATPAVEHPDDVYRVGRTLGTTIYNIGEDQPCVWVPDNKALACKIVELLNSAARNAGKEPGE